MKPGLKELYQQIDFQFVPHRAKMIKNEIPLLNLSFLDATDLRVCMFQSFKKGDIGEHKLIRLSHLFPIDLKPYKSLSPNDFFTRVFEELNRLRLVNGF